jgi:orotidine-5'-phosphate decarboxylase
VEQLLVALDVDTVDDARRLADRLRGVVGGFKVGSRLFTGHGSRFVEELIGRGDRVFLDLKFHDIPNTVAGAVGAAARLGVWMVNVHASGGLDMMRAAREAADEEAAKVLQSPPLVIAVTVLTSMGETTLADIGVAESLGDHVVRLATLAQSAALDGVVASPREIALIRAQCGERFAIVTPGIRGLADLKGDQTRTDSAQAALEAGATFIVVGRPIIAAQDPRRAAEAIAEECRSVTRPIPGG